jgi:signal recognition particle receptor subunit beta
MRMSYLRGMHGYLLVVDGTRRQTLEDALALNERVVAEIGKVPAVLALNKFDLTDQWEIEPARETQLTAEGWTVAHTSAKTGDAVEKAFLHLAQAMLAK